MPQRETIINRIKKLLSLGNDKASAQEAASAVLMAQRLIVKYGISDGELATDDSVARNIVEKETEPLVSARYLRWELADLIATSFRCKHWQSEDWTSKLNKRPWRYKFVFYGYELDAQAASLIFNYLYRIGNRHANAEVRQFKKRNFYTRGVYSSYVTGFLAGIRSELEKQSEELMVTISPEVVKRYEMGPGVLLDDVRSNAHFCVPITEVIDKGRHDGVDAVRSRRLEDAHNFALCEQTA